MREDNGFQGFRPGAFGDVWDRMTSPQRRFAFWSDVVEAAVGAGLVYVLVTLV